MFFSIFFHRCQSKSQTIVQMITLCIININGLKHANLTLLPFFKKGDKNSEKPHYLLEATRISKLDEGSSPQHS